MKIVMILTGVALAGTANQLAPAQDAIVAVTAYVCVSIGDPGLAPVRQSAQFIASQMLATAGVRILWRMGRPQPEDDLQPLQIEISADTPEAFHRGALAYAQVFDGVHITIFYDRLRNSYDPRAIRMLLAHVLVHEITHVLEGVDTHSEEGIMKTHWTADDLKQMAYKPLPFGIRDVQLIRKGLDHRSHRVKAVALQRVPVPETMP